MALTTLLPNGTGSFNIPQDVTYAENGYSTDVNGVTFPLQVGVPISPIYTFKVIPATAVAGSICANYVFGTSAAGAFLPLSTVVSGAAPNICAIPFTFGGKTGVLMDCEQCPFMDFSIPSTAAFEIRVQGYDYRGVAFDFTQDFGTGVGNAFLCPMSFITSFQFLSNPFTGTGGVVTISNSQPAGRADIGFPYFLTNSAYVLNASYGGTALTPSTACTPGYSWRTLATSSPAFYSPRGYVSLPTAPDGIKEFIITYYIPGADSELNNEIVNKIQSSLKVASIQKTASSQYPNPVFVENNILPQDLVGVQYNPGLPLVSGLGGDQQFYIHYANACLS